VKKAFCKPKHLDIGTKIKTAKLEARVQGVCARRRVMDPNVLPSVESFVFASCLKSRMRDGSLSHAVLKNKKTRKKTGDNC